MLFSQLMMPTTIDTLQTTAGEVAQVSTGHPYLIWGVALVAVVALALAYVVRRRASERRAAEDRARAAEQAAAEDRARAAEQVLAQARARAAKRAAAEAEKRASVERERAIKLAAADVARRLSSDQRAVEEYSRAAAGTQQPVHLVPPETGPTGPEARNEPKPVPRIGYRPSTTFEQAPPFTYPFVLMPRPNSVVKYPRKGRKGNRGYCEEAFDAHVRRHFSETFQVLGDRRMVVKVGIRPYEPDLVLANERDGLNLFIDVEVDEPYDGVHRTPTHCVGADAVRDAFFVSRGWIVVRFAEVQVHTQPEACCRFLASVIRSVVPTFGVPPSLRNAGDLDPVQHWSTEEAHEMAARRYRESYLGVTSFRPVETDSPIEVEETEEEQEAEKHVTEVAPVVPPSVQANRAREEDRGASGPFRQGRGSGLRGPVPAPSPGRLQQANPHPRDSGITFDPEEHRYYIHGNPDTVSATELVARFFPTFDAVKVAGRIVNSSRPNVKYAGMSVEEIVAKWEADGERARRDGTALHEAIEAHYDGARPQGAGAEFDYFLAFVRDHPELRPYRSEWRIYDEHVMVAGTVDMLYRDRDGSLVMFDWKRTKELKEENPWQSGYGPLAHLPDANFWRYALQQNVYRRILERRYGLRVREMNLLVLHPKHGGYQRHTVPEMEREVEIIMRR